MMRLVALLATLASTALAQSRPEEALVSAVFESKDQQRLKPEFFGTDEKTAALLLKIATAQQIELTDQKRALHCPWSGPSPTGYFVEIEITRTKGDSAWGHFSLKCWTPNRGPRGGFATGGSAILTRTDGKWSVARWLDRFIT